VQAVGHGVPQPVLARGDSCIPRRTARSGGASPIITVRPDRFPGRAIICESAVTVKLSIRKLEIIMASGSKMDIYSVSCNLLS
jgi:hypothetical protein